MTSKTILSGFAYFTHPFPTFDVVSFVRWRSSTALHRTYTDMFCVLPSDEESHSTLEGDDVVWRVAR